MARFKDWPEPYLPDDDRTKSPKVATWSKDQVTTGAKQVATRFLSDPGFALSYLDVVKKYEADLGEHMPEYKVLIETAYAGHPATFNSNDFANVHHATWLCFMQAITSIANHNPHGDWGDPPANGSTHRDPDPGFRFFHNIPNATGYYAVSTLDTGAPDLGG